MAYYAYEFHIEKSADEIFVRFPQLPEIITAMHKEQFSRLKTYELQEYANDAVLAALQGRISARLDIPDSVNPNLIKSDGFVVLTVQQAMKLELYKLYRQNARSVTEFAKQIQKTDTSARRLLNLHHQSWTSEIEAAIASFGKRLVHNWEIAIAIPTTRISNYIDTPNI